MSDFTAKKIDEMEGIYFNSLKRARAELGVTSLGMAIIDMPANADQYPEHDHSGDGQEEVYIALSGSGEIEIEGERQPIDPETIIRVGPGTKRKVWPGDQGLRLLALGGVPGKAYEISEFSKLGAPDPTAQTA